MQKTYNPLARRPGEEPMRGRYNPLAIRESPREKVLRLKNKLIRLSTEFDTLMVSISTMTPMEVKTRMTVFSNDLTMCARELTSYEADPAVATGLQTFVQCGAEIDELGNLSSPADQFLPILGKAKTAVDSVAERLRQMD